jgi:hypothetical protein
MHGPQALASTGGADRLEVGEQAVALDRGADLLGARRDQQLGLGGEALGRGLAGDRRGAGDVLVGGVGARADQAAEISSGQPFSRAAAPTPAPDLVGAVGGVGAVDQRLELSRSISMSWS